MKKHFLTIFIVLSFLYSCGDSNNLQEDTTIAFNGNIIFFISDVDGDSTVKIKLISENIYQWYNYLSYDTALTNNNFYINIKDIKRPSIVPTLWGPEPIIKDFTFKYNSDSIELCITSNGLSDTYYTSLIDSSITVTPINNPKFTIAWTRELNSIIYLCSGSETNIKYAKTFEDSIFLNANTTQIQIDTNIKFPYYNSNFFTKSDSYIAFYRYDEDTDYNIILENCRLIYHNNTDIYQWQLRIGIFNWKEDTYYFMPY